MVGTCKAGRGRVIRQSPYQASVAGAGHRGSSAGGQAACGLDVEGSDAAVSGGVVGAESAIRDGRWRRVCILAA